MTWVSEWLRTVAGDVWSTIVFTWPFLLFSIVLAAALTAFVGTGRLEGWLRKRVWVGVVGAVALASLTPFCSCGTVAVIMAGMASSTPWAPMVTFMVSSPLTSPAELLLSAGLMGWPFALVYFIGTIFLGLGAGAVTALIERTGWLRDQARMRPSDSSSEAACATEVRVPGAVGGPGAASVQEMEQQVGLRVSLMRSRMRRFGQELVVTGRRLVVYFLVFTAAGYAAIRAIPTGWVTDLVGGGSAGSVPVAAVAGIPVYVSAEASLPLVAALMDGGMGTGAALAFLATGAGASIGSVSGLLIIARRRVVGLVLAILLVGGMLMGWFGDLIL